MTALFLSVVLSVTSLVAESHWAYQPIKRPKAPSVGGNKIDSFLNTRLAKAGLAPSRLAMPERQLRRVYLDLIGRPPQPGEGRDFLANPTRRGYERLVDRLLASPQYGEMWARRWLDLSRYADSNGFQADQ